MRVPDVRKWQADRIEAVQSWPWQLSVKKDPAVIFREDVDRGHDKPDLSLPASRRLAMKQADFDAYGHTQGCARCEHDIRYGYGRTARGHSEACRQRIMGELAKTDSGQMRIAAATNRMDRHLAEVVEKSDKQSGGRCAAGGEVCSCAASSTRKPVRELSEHCRTCSCSHSSAHSAT